MAFENNVLRRIFGTCRLEIIIISIIMALQLSVGTWPLFQFS
jgi:hypothetical protein